MFLKRIGLVAVLACAGASIAGCADRYGYGGVSTGYGYADGYAGEYGYGDPYGYGNGYPSYFGWYGDFYYPGTGIYVYDRDRRPFRWNGDQRRYWEGHRNGARADRNFRDNWNGFAQRPNGPGYGRDRGRGAFNGRPGANGTPGNNDAYRRDGVQGRSYGGRWRNRPGVAAPQDAVPSAAMPQGAPSAAAGPRGGGRGWGGGGRGGRGGRGRP